MFNFFLALDFLETLSNVRIRRRIRKEAAPARGSAEVDSAPQLVSLPDVAAQDVASPTMQFPDREPTPPPGPSGFKHHADDEELIPIKLPKRRRVQRRRQRKSAAFANELIKMHLAEIRLGKRLWMRRRQSPAKNNGATDNDNGADRVDNADDADRVDNADDADNDDGVYEVESIRDEKVHPSGDKFYLIKWVGSESPTWEPAEHLVDCRQSLDDFEATFDAGYDDRSVIDSSSEHEY